VGAYNLRRNNRTKKRGSGLKRSRRAVRKVQKHNHPNDSDMGLAEILQMMIFWLDLSNAQKFTL